MNHSQAVTLIKKQTGLTNKAIAEQLGLRSHATIAMRTGRESVQLYNILEILDVMGYEMVAMPKNSPPFPEGAYVISREDYS